MINDQSQWWIQGSHKYRSGHQVEIRPPPATDAERFPEPALDLDSVLVPVWPVSPYRAIDREIGLQWRAALLLVVLGVVAFGAYKAIRRSANPAQAV